MVCVVTIKKGQVSEEGGDGIVGGLFSMLREVTGYKWLYLRSLYHHMSHYACLYSLHHMLAFTHICTHSQPQIVFQKDH